MYEASIGDTFDILTTTPSGISTCDLPDVVSAVFMDQLYTFSVSCLTNQITLEVTDKVLSVAEVVLEEAKFIMNPNPVTEQAIILYKTPNPVTSTYQGIIYNVLGQQMLVLF